MNTKIVKAHTKTTLEIDANWFPVRLLTARQAISNLVRHHQIFKIGKLKIQTNFVAMDENMKSYDWNSWINNETHLLSSGNYPIIQTHNHSYPVPTILRILTRYKEPENKKHKRSIPTLQELLEMYDYTCQLTDKRYDPSEYNPREIFNKEHTLPRSKGGTNDDFNVVLATQEANSKKADTYPYFKKDGTAVKPKLKFNPFPHLNLRNVTIRPEWECLLLK